MNLTNKQRFAAWAILVSLGWLTMMWIRGLAGIFFLSSVIMIPREWLDRVPQRKSLWMTRILVVFIVAIVVIVAAKILVPASSSERAVEQFLRQPAVIISLWLLSLGLGYRVWRKRIHNAASGHDPA